MDELGGLVHVFLLFCGVSLIDLHRQALCPFVKILLKRKRLFSGELDAASAETYFCLSPIRYV